MTSYEIDIQLQPSTFNIDLVTPFITVGGGGVTIHNETTDRDAADAHPQGSVTGLVDDLAAKLEDAPIDGVQYARQDGAWSGVEAGGGGGGFTQQTLIDAATVTWNVANGNWGTLTIQDDRLINSINAEAGQEMILDIIQGTGGNHSVVWDAKFEFMGSVIPILSSTEGAVDSFRFKVKSDTELEFLNATFDVR